MYLGQLVEKAPADALFKNTMHPYSKALLSAIPIPSLKVKREKILLKGEISSPIDPAPGCRFAPRCPHAMDICTRENPQLLEIEKDHFVSCFLFTK